jgi:hypothetical protein
VQAGTPQSFVGVNIAYTRDDRLIQQRTLQACLPAFDLPVERIEREKGVQRIPGNMGCFFGDFR